MKGILLVNFGGPRSLDEVEPFLKTLLTDKDVIRTNLPSPIQTLLFKRVARKRAETVKKDYSEIGGKSPIYEDTEKMAEMLHEKLGMPVLTFHRYLPSTHKLALSAIEAFPVREIDVFPLFPQFSYATTGSIARFFEKHLSKQTLQKLMWVKSYPTHPAYIALMQAKMRQFIEEKGLKENEVIFLFSAHGLPEKFIETGDHYQVEIEASVKRVMEGFPLALAKTCYQSKFGPDEWIKPYTVDSCETIRGWHEGREHVVFVPISFTSDHIETLYEVEKLYLPIVADQGLKPYRMPAFNCDPEWIGAISKILHGFTPVHNSMLVRKS